MNKHQIAVEAAEEIGYKAHKNIPTTNAYYPDIAKSIIEAAIEKATSSSGQEKWATTEGGLRVHTGKEFMMSTPKADAIRDAHNATLQPQDDTKRK